MEIEYALKPIPVPEQKPAVDAVKASPGFTHPEERTEKPENYTAVDYFNLKDWGQLNVEPRLDVFNIREKIEFIDQFTRKEIENRGLIAGKHGYSEILKEIESLTQTGDATKREQRIGKIYDLVKTMSRQKSEKSRMSNILKIISKKFG